MDYRTKYEYKGFKYQPVHDEEPGENIKIFHDVVTPDGKTIQFSISPYVEPTEELFQKWIDVGQPGRVSGDFGSRNLIADDIEFLLNRMLGNV